MVDVLGPGRQKVSFGQRLSQGIGSALETGTQMFQEHQQQQQLAEAYKQMGIHPGTPPELAKQILANQGHEKTLASQFQNQKELLGLKGQQKEEALRQKMSALGGLFGQEASIGGQSSQREMAPQEQEISEQGNGFDPSQIPDEAIARAAMIDPNLARSLQHAKDVALREKREEQKQVFDREKFQATEKERERNHQTSYSKKAEDAANVLRQFLPKKEMALDFARNAVETQDMSYFSPDKIADATGISLFRTAKGAQLVTAGKENLLSNLSRVSSKGQNLWFEQRLNSMFPMIGQSKEANLTVLEMLEGEAQMDRAYLKEFDRLSAEDEAQYGFVRKDIEKRSRDAVKPIEKEVMKRTTYRMKEIEEVEHGLKKLNEKVGKNVVKGTPLTMAMAKLYKEKFGDKALSVAEKNGYYIPTIEEFQAIRAEPSEFRETISP